MCIYHLDVESSDCSSLVWFARGYDETRLDYSVQAVVVDDRKSSRNRTYTPRTARRRHGVPAFPIPIFARCGEYEYAYSFSSIDYAEPAGMQVL